VSKVTGEQSAGYPCRGAVVFAGSECGQHTAAFDDSVLISAVDRAQDAWSTQGGGQCASVGGHRGEIVFAGQDETSSVEAGRIRFGSRGGRRRKQCGDGTDSALRCCQNGRARSHTVSGKREAIRMHADRSVAKSHTTADVQRGE